MGMSKLVNIFIGASEEEQEEAKDRIARVTEDDEEEKDSRKARRKSSEDEDEDKESRKSGRKSSEDEEDEAEEEDDKESRHKARKARRKSSEDEEEDEKAKAALMAKNPRLYDAIRREGALQERGRIKAIEEMAFAGHADMIREAKFVNPCSAETLALRLVKAENNARRVFGANYEADAAEAAGVPAAGIGSGDSGGNDAVISAMVEGLKASGHKHIERR